MIEFEPLVILANAAHYRAAYEVGANGVLEARVMGTSVNNVCKSELSELREPLKLGSIDDLNSQRDSVPWHHTEDPDRAFHRVARSIKLLLNPNQSINPIESRKLC